MALNPHLAHLITVRPSNSCSAAQSSHAVASSQAGQQQQPRAAPAADQRAAGSCTADQALRCGHAGQQQDPAAAPVSGNMVAGGTGTPALAGPPGSGLQSSAGAPRGQLSKERRVEEQSSCAGESGQQTAHERGAGCSGRSAPSPGPGADAGSADGILLPAVLPGESFSFSMCNPPFFSSMAEAGLNPSTAHGGGHRAVSATEQHVVSGTLLGPLGTCCPRGQCFALHCWEPCGAAVPFNLDFTPTAGCWRCRREPAAAWPCRRCRHSSQCVPPFTLPPQSPQHCCGTSVAASFFRHSRHRSHRLHALATGIGSDCLSVQQESLQRLPFSPVAACSCRHSC